MTDLRDDQKMHGTKLEIQLKTKCFCRIHVCQFAKPQQLRNCWNKGIHFTVVFSKKCDI